MAKRIVVVKCLASASLPNQKLPPPSLSKVRYLAEKSMKELEAAAERRKAGALLPTDDVEEIIEWL